ncbi:MAG TPA: MATE family efflux transporter [Ignavibacteriaceae bacterium]|nr:MATE family efflux transporter [Ignavibacteriaceae bacterium]
MIGQLGIILMNVIDAIMVGELGPIPLAASSVANSLFILIFIIGVGVALSVSPLVAIAVGENRHYECELLFKNSLFVNVGLNTILFLLTFALSPFLRYLNQPDEVVGQAIIFTNILAFSLIPTSIYHSYKQFIEGLQNTKPAMIITLTAVLINVFINYLLIYGNWGLPRLGLFGAGIGTFTARTFMAFIIFLYVTKSTKYKNFDLKFRFKDYNYKIVRKILAIGLPSGMQYFFEVGAFSFAVIMVGWLGTVQLAAHQIAINLASVPFMAATGISVAGSIRVGNALGRRDVKEIRQAGFTAISLGASIMIFSGIIFVVFNNYLPALYVNDQAVIRYASTILIIAAMFQIFDGTQAVGIGVLRGLTDVKGPTAITFISYWLLALPIGYYLGFKLHLDISGVWYGLLIGLIASATLLTLRFNYKSRRVVH